MVRLLSTGDRLEWDRYATVLHCVNPRKTLSTSALNGGLRNDLRHIFNFNDSHKAKANCSMHGETMQEHQCHIAESLQLDTKITTGLNTAANTNNTVVEQITLDGICVTAIVTAGIEVNACRVGETALLRERAGKCTVLSGTINMILVIDANLTDACMTRALVTGTEAKVAALQELMAASRFSSGLATGSSTDGTIIVSNTESSLLLCEAGEQFQLGECIGKVVKLAVKNALYRQSGLCAHAQHTIFRRAERFGITPQAVYDALQMDVCDLKMQVQIKNKLAKINQDGYIVTLVSVYVHLIDQQNWGLLLPQEALDAGMDLLNLMRAHYALPPLPEVLPYQQLQNAQEVMVSACLAELINWVQESIDPV